MVKVVSILNMKGGVGKTMITFTLAYALAAFHDKKVLAIDFDPQANLSEAFMTFQEYREHRDNKKVISDIFSDLEAIVGPVTRRHPHRVTLDSMISSITQFEDGGCIDLVPSELELSDVLQRSGGANLERRLKLVLDGRKNAYDFVLIDCAPTYSVLTNNSLVASDFVLIPVRPDPFSSRGIPLLLQKIDTHNSASPQEEKIEILGIVFSMVREKQYVTSVKSEIYREQRNVFQSEIRYHENYSRGIFDNKTIYETNATSEFKEGFSAFVNEFLRRTSS